MKKMAGNNFLYFKTGFLNAVRFAFIYCDVNKKRVVPVPS